MVASCACRRRPDPDGEASQLTQVENSAIVQHNDYAVLLREQDGQIGVESLESARLGGLNEKLPAPEPVAEFVREFHAEWNRQTQENERQSADRKGDLTETERRLAAIMTAIESGVVTASTNESYTSSG